MSTPKAPPKATPRFVPTLTEIVEPIDARPSVFAAMDELSGLNGQSSAQPLSPQPPEEQQIPQARVDRLVNQLLERLEPQLHAQVEKMLTAMVQAQVELLTQRLNQDLEKMVRRAVIQSLSKRQAPKKNDTNGLS